MTRRKSVLGALVLCALSLCAFGAANASAEGLTAFTCTEGTTGERFSDAHCLTPSAGGEFHTEAVPAGTVTEVTGEAVTSGGTKPTLTATLALVKVEIICNAMMTEGGTLENQAGPPMKVVGAGILLHYTECEAQLASDHTKKCEIENKTGNTNKGTITTTTLKSSTSFEGTASHFATFEPVAGTTFTQFKLLQTAGSTCPTALVGIEPIVTGSARGQIPTTMHSHITFEGQAGGKLIVGGQKAEYMATHSVVMSGTTKTIGLKTS